MNGEGLRVDVRRWLIGVVVGLAVDGLNYTLFPGEEGQLFLVLYVGAGVVMGFAITLALLLPRLSLRRALWVFAVMLGSTLAHAGAWVAMAEPGYAGAGAILLRGLGVLLSILAYVLALFIARTAQAKRRGRAP